MSVLADRSFVFIHAIEGHHQKASVTVHLPKGVQGHRRQKGVRTLPANGLRQRKAA